MTTISLLLLEKVPERRMRFTSPAQGYAANLHRAFSVRLAVSRAGTSIRHPLNCRIFVLHFCGALAGILTDQIIKSNVLQFVMNDGTKISARPSGTEPKIKFYFSVNAKLNDIALLDATEKKLDEKIERIAKEMKLK